MAGSGNVVEIRLRTVNEFARGFADLRRQLSGVGNLVRGLFAGLTLRAFVRNIEEAQAAAVQLDVAFEAVDGTLGRTRGQLDELAESLQRTTVFSDDAVRGAEALLLTFDKVRGDAFERTIRAAADLSARLGTDLSSAVSTLGRALQDPARGMDALRRTGVVLSSEQRALVKSFLEAGDAVGAQSALLGIVERKYRGAATAARTTLGGALRSLGNTFGDLFEQTREQSAGAVEAIEDLNEALTDPNVKRGIDELVAGFFSLATQVLRVTAEIPAFTTWLAELAAGSIHGPDSLMGRLTEELAGLNKEIEGRQGELGIFRDADQEAALVRRRDQVIEQIRELQRLEDQLALTRLRGAQAAGGASATAGGAGGGFVDDLAEIEVIARRLPETVGDPVADLLADMEERTRTSLERQLGDWADFEADLKVLVATGTITADAAQARRLERLDEELEEIKVTVRKLPPVISEEMSAASEAALEATRDIQGAFADAFVDIRNGFDDFDDSISYAFARLFANIAANAVVELLGIEKLLKDMAKSFSTSGSSGSGGGALQALGSLFAGFFTGGSAAGGLASGLQVVGEDGAELVDFERGRVFNKRQLAFAGAGNAASVVFAPVHHISIVNPTGPLDQIRGEMAFALAASEQRSSREFEHIMYRNGFGRLR